MFSKKVIFLSTALFFAVSRYLGFLARVLYHFKWFTNPKILGHATTAIFISPFLKIYGDE